MGFLDKVREQAEQAAVKAREGMEELQTKRELGQAYGDLGRTAFELVERGELSHVELNAGVERVRSLKAQLESEQPAPTAAGVSASEAEPGPPPATPT